MEEEPQLSPEEEYQAWKDNCGYLYDRLVVTNLEWPSLTFTWLPEKIESSNTITYKYVYSTNSSGNRETESLYFAKMEFPKLKDIEDDTVMTKPKQEIIFEIAHPGQPNRIVSHPTNPNQIATKTIVGVINIYREGLQYPVQLLTGHQQEGYGIDWKSQGLVSGSYDGQVLAWKDVHDSNSTPTFVGTYKDKIQDVKWVNQNGFVSVADDGVLAVWDIRSKGNVSQHKLHDKQINTVAINPVQKQLILTGDQDGLIRLWDHRNLKHALYPFYSHQDSVIRLVFSSGSVDSKVMVWDILKVGVQIPKDQTTSGQTELLFTHRGHRGAVSDLSWNPFQQMLGSVQEQYNTLQFYQIASTFFENDNVEDFEFQKQQILA